MSATRNAWYRQPMLLLVAGVPVVSMALSLTMLVLANAGPTDLVRADWYKHGKAVNQDLGRQRLAEQLGLAAQVRTSAGLVTVTLRGAASPDTLQLALIHPTRAAGDRHLLLHKTGPGLWQATIDGAALPALAQAVQIEPPDRRWLLQGHGRLAAGPGGTATVVLGATAL